MRLSDSYRSERLRIVPLQQPHAPLVRPLRTVFHVLRHIKHCGGKNGAVLYVEFLAELERAGLTVRNFAELIGMNPNSITNYAGKGELPQHIALIAVLVTEMGAQGLDYRTVIARVAPTRKPRGATRRGQFGGDRQASLDLLS